MGAASSKRVEIMTELLLIVNDFICWNGRDFLLFGVFLLLALRRMARLSACDREHSALLEVLLYE